MRIKKTVGLKSLNGGAKVSKKQVLKNVEEKKKSGSITCSNGLQKLQSIQR